MSKKDHYMCENCAHDWHEDYPDCCPECGSTAFTEIYEYKCLTCGSIWDSNTFDCDWCPFCNSKDTQREW